MTLQELEQEVWGVGNYLINLYITLEKHPELTQQRGHIETIISDPKFLPACCSDETKRGTILALMEIVLNPKKYNAKQKLFISQNDLMAALVQTENLYRYYLSKDAQETITYHK